MNYAEDLASKLLQCSPKNRLSAQAALSHEYFSDLPPRLWELTDSEYDKSETSNQSRHIILASLCNALVGGFVCFYMCIHKIMYVCICITCTHIYVRVSIGGGGGRDSETEGMRERELCVYIFSGILPFSC